ncbi:MAG: response regulator [Granulosicoccus sp.]|nr:response regulator [Granulosicoccus sp.]
MSARLNKATGVGLLPAEHDSGRQADDLRQVLLLDEQAHVLRIMRLNLERSHYVVDTALNADLVLRLLQAKPYDALIITSDLPDMCRQDLYERVHDQLASRRSSEPMARQPLLMIAGDEDDDWLNQVEDAERLTNPVSLKWILNRLERVFGDVDSPGEH